VPKSGKDPGVVKFIPGPGGLAQISVSLTDLAAPVLVGFADKCAIQQRGSMTEFVFFEKRNARNVVVARFVSGPEDLVNTLWRSSEAVYREMRANLASAGIQPDQLSDSLPDVGDQPSVLCNLFVLARGGSSALLDCYYVNPRSIFVASQGKGKASVVPIVSIQMPVSLLIAVLEYVERHLDSLRAESTKLGAPPS